MFYSGKVKDVARKFTIQQKPITYNATALKCNSITEFIKRSVISYPCEGS